MDETALIGQILNLGEGWVVQDMIVNKSMKEVDIFIEYTKSTGCFSGTKSEFKIYDFKQSRRFRHLDIFEYKTYLNARLPRIKNDNSEIKIIELCWAGERLNYTYLFENRVIELLQISKNQTKTADYFNTTYDIVHGIMERAVARGLKRRDLNGIRAISLDEKSIGNGQKYISVLSDPINKCVLDIIEGRKVEDTEELLTWTLSPKQLDNIWIVSMDMWKPYLLAVEEIIPQADIVHDKFHIAKYLNKAVDDVRKEEIKEQEVLKKTKYLFLKNKENWTEYQTIKFEEINQINLATSHAWQIKENFKGIYEQGNKQLCINYFEQWYKDVIEKNIKPMIKVADTMLKHIKGIVNAAVTDITNSIAENLNAQIQVVKSIARGYANANSYRNAILFFQGNLKMFHS